MAIHYVDTAADPGGDGTTTATTGANCAFNTIAAITYALTTGDESDNSILFKRGCTWQEQINWDASGTDGHPFTIGAYGTGADPILDGNNWTVGDSALVRIWGSYVTVENLELRYSYGSGYIGSGDHCIAQNIYSHHNAGAGIYMIGSYGLIDNCRSYLDSYDNFENAAEYNSFGISMNYNDPGHGTIRNCTVAECWGEGISTFRSYDITIEDCVAYNCHVVNFYLQNAVSPTLQRCLSYYTPGNPMETETEVCILIGDEGGLPLGMGHRVVNNLCLGGYRCLAAGLNPASSSLFAHNTLVNTTPGLGDYTVLFYASSGDTTSVFKDNIILEEGAAAIGANLMTGLTCDYNCWSTPAPAELQGANDINDDPLLAKSGSTAAGELTGAYFKIPTASPCKDAGVDVGVSADYFLTGRDATPDIGAHEFTSSYGLVFMTGFEYGTATPSVAGGGLFDTVVGAPTIQGTYKHSGDYALECAAAGADVYVKLAPGVWPNKWVIRFYVRCSSIHAGLNWLWRSGGVSTYFGIRAAADGGWFHLWNSTSGYVNGDVAPTAGVWYCIDMMLNGDTPAIDWQIDGAAQTPITDAAGTYWDSLDFGYFSAGTMTVQFDDIVMSTTLADYPIGIGGILGLRPSADGTHNNAANTIEDEDNNDIHAVNFPAWSKLDESPWITTTNDDLVTQVAIAAARYAEVTFPDIATNEIQGVRAILQYCSSDTGIANTGGCAIVDIADAETAIWGKAGALADYQVASNIPYYKSVILTPPAGGWTFADVNALRLRLGYSDDVTPAPRWLATMLEVAYGDYAPEITVSHGVTAIADGGTYDFGNVYRASHEDVELYIGNEGTGNLTLLETTPLVLGGTDPTEFSIQLQPASPVVPSGHSTCIIRFSPTSAGAKSATIALVSDDADEGTYNITLEGTGLESYPSPGGGGITLGITI